MSVDGWSLVRFVHVTAAMGWVGGQLLLSAVVLPVLRRQLEPAARGPLVHAVARRFALAANAALLPLLVVTGMALAWHRGVTFGSIDDPGYGRLLGIKLVLVVVSMTKSVLRGQGVLTFSHSPVVLFVNLKSKKLIAASTPTVITGRLSGSKVTSVGTNWISAASSMALDSVPSTTKRTEGYVSPSATVRAP